MNFGFFWEVGGGGRFLGFFLDLDLDLDIWIYETRKKKKGCQFLIRFDSIRFDSTIQ